MTTNEIISILRSNCARLAQIVDDQEMQKIYEATDEAIIMVDKRTMLPVRPNYECPDCGRNLICNCHISDFRYCPHCGKRLGWKEDYD